jgi:zinc protease
MTSGIHSTPPLSLTTGVQKNTLDNGLTVLLKTISTAPVVSVQIWYRVGARNETPGLNGISHQLEHLMFKGTQARPIQFGRLFSALGAAANAFTSYDMTAYYGTAHRDQLEALLVLEADRMGNIQLDEASLQAEKRVVISELQGYENQPGYRLGCAVMAKALAPHPYGLPVGGTKTDVEAFTLEQVQTYYQTYYRPDNAVLVITGDIDPAETLTLIQQTFGQLHPPRPPLGDPTKVLPTFAPQAYRFHLSEPGSAVLLERCYPLVPMTHPDAPALDLLDAILTTGHNSRLHQSLVESGLAAQVGGYTANLMEAGWYGLSVVASPEADLGAVEAQLEHTLATVASQSVSAAELNRARQQLISQFIFGSRDVDAQASQLAYNELTTGDYEFSDRYLATLNTITPEQIQRVAQTYLTPDRLVQGIFIPSQMEEMPLGVGTTHTQENFTPPEPVDPDEVAAYLPPHSPNTTPHHSTLATEYTLENGLKVILLADPSTPTLTLCAHLDAGNGYDLFTLPGVASLTADTLLCGTPQHSEQVLTQRLEDRGIYLDFQSYREGVEIEGHALAGDLEPLLTTLAEVLQTPIFPEEKVTLARQQSLTQLQMDLDDPGRVGRRQLQQLLYPPEHPFYPYPTLESLQAITQDHLIAHHRQYYRPEQMVLVLVGDFDLPATQALIQREFGQWQTSASAQALPYLDPSPSVAKPAVAIPLPGKSQVITYMGHLGLTRRDPRYYTAVILNEILGGDTLSSRLGQEIRDRQGLTYGIYSYFSAGQHTGSFVIEMQTSPTDTPQAVESTLHLLQQLRAQGVSATEFKTVQRSLLNSYPVEMANPDAIAQRLLVQAVDGRPVDDLQQIPERIAAVTREQVQESIAELIRPEDLVIVHAGPV